MSWPKIGSVTGVSIAALFTGGLIPGLVLAVMLCIVVWRRYRNEDLSHVKRASLGTVGTTFIVAGAYQRFGSPERLLAASPEELEGVPGVPA